MQALFPAGTLGFLTFSAVFDILPVVFTIPFTVLTRVPFHKPTAARNRAAAALAFFRKLIITVTLNTAVDKTYTISNFSLDRVHRPSEWKIVPGGKGINVSRVLKELGVESLALGFAGGYNGRFIERGLNEEGINHKLVPTEQESRVCTTIIDPEHRTQTEVNELGPLISQQELALLEEILIHSLKDSEGLVLSGSLPPGVPNDIYFRWTQKAHEMGCWVVLDSSGQAMREGIRANPDTAKPNLSELSDLTRREHLTTDEILESAEELVQSGVGTMLVSMGRSGALAVDSKYRWCAVPPEIDFVSAVGSGDSFVAGFIWAKREGKPLDECLKIATAAGAANAMHFGAGFCSKECILSLASQVDIRPLAREKVSG